MSDLLKILPLAIVMVAGPQIISAIMLATSGQARKNSIAYVSGAMLAATIGTALAFTITELLNTSSSSSESGPTTIDYVLVGLLLILAFRVYLKRDVTEPPKWMAKLQTAEPKFAFRLGLTLFLLMPTDIITMVTVGSYLSAHDSAFRHAVPFLLLTALLVGSPLLILLLLGKRADVMLPKMRDWMSTNAWVVSEIVIAFFLVMELNTILSG